MRFSQRIGTKPIKTTLQVASIDEPLMNRLWNCILITFFDRIGKSGSYVELVCKIIWTEFYELRIDKIPVFTNGKVYIDGVIKYMEEWFFEDADWDEIYDLVEFLSTTDLNGLQIGFTENCNKALKKEISGYRIIEGNVVQITAEEEIQSIEEALTASDSFKSVSNHLKASLDFLSDRKSPDFRNSIKESISAVEGFCKIITRDEKATLGKALAIIEKQHNLHSSLKEAYNKIYGYTSDADGIRHSMLEDGVDISFEDAKFMLVSCTAFINYLRTKLKI